MAQREKTVFTMQSEYMDRYQMQKERNNRRKKRLIQRLIVMSIIMSVVTAIAIHYHVNQRALFAEKLIEHEVLQEEMATLEKEKAELSEEIDLLSDDAYILDIARTNYFLSKKGEVIFQVQESNRSN